MLSILLVALVVSGSSAQADIQIFANGLYNPKDIEFDDQGNLYVAESGEPGKLKVPLPAQYGSEGPIGYGGQVTRITPDGKQEKVVTGLPNLGIYSGAELLGPSGLAWHQGRLYLVQAAHLTESPWLNEVLVAQKKLRRIVDVGAFNKKNLASDDNGDAVPFGNPYDLISWQGSLFISDGNYNRILKATPEGTLEIFAQSPRQTTTTGMTIGPDGYLYITQFGNAPYYAGSGRVDRVSPKGEWESGYVTHLQNPLGVAFDSKGTMYVLQFASLFSPAQLKYLPYGGRVLKVNPDRSTTLVVSDLTYPTFMKFDSKDNLWVVNYGNQSSGGQGQILKIRLGGGVVKGPRVVLPGNTPTEEVLKAEARAREQLGKMNETKARQQGVVVRIVEVGDDTLKWGYDPAVAHVKAGETLTFLNAGKMPHTATSNEGVFDTGYIPAGQTRTLQLTKGGKFGYLCTPHPWMKGQIVVEGGAEAGDTGALAEGHGGSGSAGPTRLVSPLALGALFAALVGLTFLVAFSMRKRD